jgi:hypothetical protein
MYVFVWFNETFSSTKEKSVKRKLWLGRMTKCSFVAFFFAAAASGQTNGLVQVSNALEGGAQNFGGKAAARCGNNIVVGFHDVEPNSPSSWAGVAASKNGGQSFSELTPITDSDPTGDSFGAFNTSNPVVICSSADTFYYAAVEFGNTFQPQTQISFSTSTDGGTTWTSPVPASAATNDIYNFQSPSMATDPSNPQNLYVVYVNISQGPETPDCTSFTGAYVLEFVASHDGGKTWNGRTDPFGPSTPNMRLDHACVDPNIAGPQAPLDAPHVLVSGSGEIYVIYEVQQQQALAVPIPDRIFIVRSVDRGATFSAPQVVSTTPIDFAAPHLAVNRAPGAGNGTLYAAWSGAPAGANSMTHTDILVSKSSDAGQTFSTALPVSAPPIGTGRFRIDSLIAVDNSGTVETCFDDTPDDVPTSNSVFSHICGASKDQGLTWQLQQVASPVMIRQLCPSCSTTAYESDGLASDFFQQHAGFFSAFEIQVNASPFIYGQRIQGQ